MRKFCTLGLSLVCFLLVVLEGRCQSVLKEINLPSGKIKNIQAFASGDNFYLLYDVFNPKKKDFLNVTLQLKQDGTANEMLYEHKENAILLAIQDEPDSAWFYYLVEEDRSLMIRALRYDHKTNKSKWQNKTIEIENNIVGIIFDKTLSVIAYDDDLNQLQYLEIDRMRRADNRSFEIPFSLKEYYKRITVIKDNDPLTSIEQGSSKVKVYKKDKKIILTIDHTLYESRSSPNTDVLVFDIASGKQTIRNFPTNARNSFRSFIHNDLLYRAISSTKILQLEIFNMLTGEFINRTEIRRDTTQNPPPIYLRNGRTFRTVKTETVNDLMATTSVTDPSVVLFTSDSCTTLLWGSYYVKDNVMIVPGSIIIAPIATLLASVTTAAITSKIEPYGISRYFYTVEPKNENSEKNLPLRQRIDDYEISVEREKIFYKYKNYAEFQRSTVGIYFDAKAMKLILVKF
jgi:hypothetical protein